MAAKQKTLDDLFLDTLKDIYYAEKQILRALPKMAKAAEAEELRQAFETHREQTQGQIERLDQVFEMIGKRSQGKSCDAMQGIIEEAKEIMENYENSEALDAGLIASAQAVEHYEITRYGTLKRWAEQLGHSDAVELLDQTLNEEKETDQLLTRIADESANQEALAEGEEDAEAEEEETTSERKSSRQSSGARR
jgi:ferritin-like metal-binding protein YciE